MLVHLIMLPTGGLIFLIVYLTILMPGYVSTLGLIVLIVVGGLILGIAIYIMAKLYKKWYSKVSRVLKESQEVIDRHLQSTLMGKQVRVQFSPIRSYLIFQFF